MFYTHSPRREWVGIYFFLYGLPMDATRRSSTFVKCQYFHSPHQFSRCFIEMELLPLLCVSNGGRNLRGIMARNVLIFSWRKKGCEFMQELTLVICSYKRVKSRYFFFYLWYIILTQKLIPRDQVKLDLSLTRLMLKFDSIKKPTQPPPERATKHSVSE